jgi:hypothetical protein
MTEVPNQYFLQGGGISVAYSPQGFGPLRLDLGPLILGYQSQGCYHDGVQTVEVGDLGTIVTGCSSRHRAQARNGGSMP